MLPADSRGESNSRPSYVEQHRERLFDPQEEKQQGQQNERQLANKNDFFLSVLFQDAVTDSSALYSQEHAMAKVVAYRHLPASMEPKQAPLSPPPPSSRCFPLQAHV